MGEKIKTNQMGRIGEQLGIDFVISTGDNFYEDGLTGVDDGAFQESFTNVYTAKSLQRPWYSGMKLIETTRLRIGFHRSFLQRLLLSLFGNNAISYVKGSVGQP